jgi:hypothetical protein
MGKIDHYYPKEIQMIRLLLALSPIILLVSMSSCGGGGGTGGGGGGGGGTGTGGGGGGGTGGGSSGSVSIANKGGILKLPGDQGANYSYSFFQHGTVRTSWDGAGFATLTDDLEIDWVTQFDLAEDLFPHWMSNGEAVLIGKTSDYGAGGIDNWFSTITTDGALGTQHALGSQYDDSFCYLSSSQNSFYWDEDHVTSPNNETVFSISGYRNSQGATNQSIIGILDTSAVDDHWTKHIDLGEVYGLSTFQTLNGGVWGASEYQRGNDEGIYIASFSSDGTPLFQNAASINGCFYFYGVPKFRRADGDVLVAGTIYTFDGGSSGWVGLLDESSGVGWNVELQGCHSINHALELSDESVILGGSIRSGGTDKVLCVRFSNSGSLQWAKAIGGLFDYDLVSMDQLPDGSIAILATAGKGVWGEKAWVAHLSTSGSLLWQKEISINSNFYPYINLRLGSGSQTLVSGRGLNDSDKDIWSAVFNSNGLVTSQNQWSNTYESSYPYVYESDGGDFTLSVPIVHPSGNGGSDILLAKWAPDLSYEWSWLYGGTGDESYAYAQVINSGEILLSGTTSSFDSIGLDTFALGLDATGQTTQTCWVSSINPNNSLPITTGAAVITSASLTALPLPFTSVDFVIPTQDQLGWASHSQFFRTAEMTPTCGN